MLSWLLGKKSKDVEDDDEIVYPMADTNHPYRRPDRMRPPDPSQPPNGASYPRNALPHPSQLSEGGNHPPRDVRSPPPPYGVTSPSLQDGHSRGPSGQEGHGRSPSAQGPPPSLQPGHPPHIRSPSSEHDIMVPKPVLVLCLACVRKCLLVHVRESCASSSSPYPFSWPDFFESSGIHWSFEHYCPATTAVSSTPHYLVVFPRLNQNDKTTNLLSLCGQNTISRQRSHPSCGHRRFDIGFETPKRLMFGQSFSLEPSPSHRRGSEASPVLVHERVESGEVLVEGSTRRRRGLDFDFGLDSSSDLASGLEEGEEEANLEAGVDVYFEEDNFLNKDFECFDEDDVWEDCKNGAVDEKDVVDSLDCVVDMLAWIQCAWIVRNAYNGDGRSAAARLPTKGSAAEVTRTTIEDSARYHRYCALDRDLAAAKMGNHTDR
ncbi:hypothetical protein CPB85DRAFT_1458925 [Mucidula mucida]|nr:hypothetical protein CPB85DRAFT_1458925 [Mucidula mucida]